jgi:hypothetical protein
VLVFQKSSEQASSVEGLGATATLNMAKERMEAGMYDQAAERLNRLGEGAQLTPAERDRLASLRAELVSLRERRQVLAHNMQGNRYFESRLQTYERTWLQGDPDHPKIRMFLIRCRDFRQRWPEHEGVAWIERQERRFQGVVDLDDPPTFTDITWEVKSLTGGKPKEYGEALDALADFLETAEGEDLAQAQDLQAQVVQERADYHLDRMKQARYELEEKGDDGESVRILVEDMLLMGDLDMENEAAGYLVRLPKAEAYLRGYERTDPETFDLVMQNAIVRAFAEKKGIVESGASGGAE